MNSKLINHDIYRFNLYCWTETLSERIRNNLTIKLNKPYLVTLFGHLNTQEVDTKSDIHVEVSNTIKAQ
jgi:hypothetical protein